MDNGRKPNGRVRLPGAPFAKSVIAVDLHGTIVVPKEGKPHSELVKEVVERVLNRRIFQSHQALARRTRKLRLLLERQLAPECRAGTSYWGLLNKELFGCTAEKAIAISQELTSNPDLYEITEERRRFFAWLFDEMFAGSGVRIVTASNASRATALVLLERAGLLKYFRESDIFTPDVIGNIFKPSTAFFQTLLQELRIDARLMLMLGNSPFHDLSAAQLGIDVVWLRDRLETLSQRDVAERVGKQGRQHVFRADTIDDARRIIEANFRIAA